MKFIRNEIKFWPGEPISIMLSSALRDFRWAYFKYRAIERRRQLIERLVYWLDCIMWGNPTRRSKKIPVKPYSNY